MSADPLRRAMYREWRPTRSRWIKQWRWPSLRMVLAERFWYAKRANR